MSFSGEKVDVYVMSKPDVGDWVFFGNAIIARSAKVL